MIKGNVVMKKLNSLAFKLPLSISFISGIIIIILLAISLFFSSKGITESINVGFRNTVEGYAYLLDALTEAQMLLANSYASDANFIVFYNKKIISQIMLNL